MEISDYYENGQYIGDEFVDYYGKEVEIADDIENGVYAVKFDDGFEADNIFSEELIFNVSFTCPCGYST